MSDSDSDVEFVPVIRSPKKRRGRPPAKAPAKAPAPTYSDKMSDSDVDFVPVIPSPKKRRGRPPAAAKAPAPTYSDKMSDSDSDSDVDFVPVIRSPKKPSPKKTSPKKRGRPSAAAKARAKAPSPTYSDKMPDSDAEVKSDSDVEVAPVMAPPKRRRMIDPSAIAPVPIYSNKVLSCFNLTKMPAATVVKTDTTAEPTEDVVLPEPVAKLDSSACFSTDSEDEEAPRKVTIQPQKVFDTIIRSPSPPPPIGSPSTRSTRASRRKVSEMNRKLNVLGSCLRTSPLKRARRHGSSPSTPTTPGSVHLDDEDDDREITLKFRWRSVLHKITVPSSAPLSKAVEELSVKIKVPPSRILLLRKERELPTDSSANELGLGIADIIDCVIIEEEENKEADENDDGIISIRIQNKERSAAQTYSLHRDAALGSVLRQYISSTYANATHRPKVVFCFDGTKITHSQTPSQLDMEDGDVIDVWA